MLSMSRAVLSTVAGPAVADAPDTTAAPGALPWPALLALLRGLDHAQSQSPEALATRCGLSVPGVHQGLAALSAHGMAIAHRPSEGYRLQRRPDLLQPGLEPMAAEGFLPWQLMFEDNCDSTNTLLMQRARQGAPHASLLLTEHQTQGRGRRGNAWHSPLGQGLAFSLLWRFDQAPPALSALSLVVGVAVARALHPFAPALRLKWPNDLLLGPAKLGGILVEPSTQPEGPLQVVIGIGLNVGPALASTALPTSSGVAGAVSSGASTGISTDIAADVARRDLPSASLRAADSLQPSRLTVLQQVLRELSLLLPQFAQSGFAPLLPEWQRMDAFRDRAVMLRDAAGRSVQGVSRGVDGVGALVLNTPQGEQRFVAGELSLRPAAGN